MMHDSELADELWSRALSMLRAYDIQLVPEELSQLQDIVTNGAVTLDLDGQSLSTASGAQALIEVERLVHTIAEEFQALQLLDPSLTANLSDGGGSPPSGAAALPPKYFFARRRAFEGALARFCPCFPFC